MSKFVTSESVFSAPRVTFLINIVLARTPYAVREATLFTSSCAAECNMFTKRFLEKKSAENARFSSFQLFAGESAIHKFVIKFKRRPL